MNNFRGLLVLNTNLTVQKFHPLTVNSDRSLNITELAYFQVLARIVDLSGRVDVIMT